MNPSDEDLKKLAMRSIVDFDLDAKGQPMPRAEAKKILDRFSDPEFADVINLALIKEKHEPGKLFSNDALQRFLHMLRLFVGGRIMGGYGEDESPEVFAVRVEIERMSKKEWEARQQE